MVQAENALQSHINLNPAFPLPFLKYIWYIRCAFFKNIWKKKTFFRQINFTKIFVKMIWRKKLYIYLFSGLKIVNVPEVEVLITYPIWWPLVKEVLLQLWQWEVILNWIVLRSEKCWDQCILHLILQWHLLKIPEVISK